jgi:hypothetical protein
VWSVDHQEHMNIIQVVHSAGTSIAAGHLYYILIVFISCCIRIRILSNLVIKVEQLKTYHATLID